MRKYRWRGPAPICESGDRAALTPETHRAKARPAGDRLLAGLTADEAKNALSPRSRTSLAAACDHVARATLIYGGHVRDGKGRSHAGTAWR